MSIKAANFDLMFEQFCDEMNNLLNSDQCIFEVAAGRSSYLKDVDSAFVKLRKNIDDKTALRELAKAIKGFTGIKQVVVKIRRDYFNAAVVPIYNRELGIDKNIFKIVSSDSVKIDKPLQNVEESIKYIKKIYILMGDEYFKIFTGRELTSIVLHELGHVFAHTSRFSYLLARTVRKYSFIGSGMSLVFGAGAVSALAIPISLLLFTISRSMTFLDHREEYNADQYAVKYGYGDEAIRALSRFGFEPPEKKGFWRRLFEWIRSLLFPKTHPEDRKRICGLVNKIRNEYINLYPKLKDELTIIFSDLKC